MQSMISKVGRYPHPENLDIHKIDLNDEGLGSFQQNKVFKECEFKLRVIQSEESGVTVPVI